MSPNQQLAVRPPAAPGRSRPRHVSVVTSVIGAWEKLSEDERARLERALPPELMRPLLRLVDPCGLRGHLDASALAAAYRAAAVTGDDELAEVLGAPLYWAVARLAQNLS